MAAAVALRNGVGVGIDKPVDGSKYVRYTAEQIEALERAYDECPKPSSVRRQQLIREHPILSNIEPRQIKVWFQNRRCRDKQKKETSRLQAVNRKLTAMNKLLMEENDRLQKQVSRLVLENAVMRQQLQNASLTKTDTSCESAVTIPQPSPKDTSDPAGLLSIAEETMAEFLSKATGTAVDWVQMPGMKPGPDSIGMVAISHSSRGVAARACGLVNLEPSKIAEALKDRPSWFSDCRKLEVFTLFPTATGGTIELVYMQMYAPTTIAPARDFWTLRYTTTLEDGSIAVCERSLSGSGVGPSASTAHQFVRAEMLPSGFLIRPCDGGSSIVHIVDHLDLEPWSVPEVLRPLYVSSKVVAQKMTTAAMHHIRQIAQESSGEASYAVGRRPAVMRSFSQRLGRGFNDAINGFVDDGWSLIAGDGAEDVVIMTRPNKGRTACPTVGGVLCAKASMLLQNVPPELLFRFLREHRSEWADYNVDALTASSMKAGSLLYPETRPLKFTGNQVIMPLAYTVENEEFLEVVKLESQARTVESSGSCLDVHLLQVCSGIDEKSVRGSCCQLIFAPIDESFQDDAPLLPSGFRVIPLDLKNPSSNGTLDSASVLDDSGGGGGSGASKENDAAAESARSVLLIAFQFPYEERLLDNVAAMARQYVRGIVSSVQRISMVISSSWVGSKPAHKLAPGSPEASTLAHWICRSYSFYTGADILCPGSGEMGESLLKMLWHHEDAILCCSLTAMPVFTFANQAGLDLLETTLVALQDITLDRIFDEQSSRALLAEFTKLMQQGHASLPGGVCASGMGRRVAYERAAAWKVLAENGSEHCLAFSFINWTFL
ncbi:homeobox-leucine zipper family protein / lipid-binding START domain-containing protein [Wolffia australiana]